MLSYIITGVICFVAGYFGGVFMMALMAASRDDRDDESWK